MRLMARTVAAGLSVTIAFATTGEPAVSGTGDRLPARATAASTQENACTLTPNEHSRIQIVKNRLDVTGLPKNSIFNYQYRIDDQPASTPAIPTAAMQEAGVITFAGDAFDEIMKGQRFRIRILDRWHEAITEDVSLAGLRDRYETMIGTCG
jgi:hypothetical protein